MVDPPRAHRTVRGRAGWFAEEPAPDPHRREQLLHLTRADGRESAESTFGICRTLVVPCTGRRADRPPRFRCAARAAPPAGTRSTRPVRAAHSTVSGPDLRVGLVACSKTKADQPTLARDLYVSPLFRAARTHAAQSYDPWLILSAHHGPVPPPTPLPPSAFPLTRLPPAPRHS